MKCLRDNDFESSQCRKQSKEYLECRMERRVPGFFLSTPLPHVQHCWLCLGCAEGGTCPKHPSPALLRLHTVSHSLGLFSATGAGPRALWPGIGVHKRPRRGPKIED